MNTNVSLQNEAMPADIFLYNTADIPRLPMPWALRENLLGGATTLGWSGRRKRHLLIIAIGHDSLSFTYTLMHTGLAYLNHVNLNH